MLKRSENRGRENITPVRSFFAGFYLAPSAPIWHILTVDGVHEIGKTLNDDVQVPTFEFYYGFNRDPSGVSGNSM